MGETCDATFVTYMLGQLQGVTIGWERFEDDNITSKTCIWVDNLARVLVIVLLYWAI